jgi:hypothetical protein
VVDGDVAALGRLDDVPEVAVAQIGPLVEGGDLAGVAAAQAILLGDEEGHLVDLTQGLAGNHFAAPGRAQGLAVELGRQRVGFGEFRQWDQDDRAKGRASTAASFEKAKLMKRLSLVGLSLHRRMRTVFRMEMNKWQANHQPQTH